MKITTEELEHCELLMTIEIEPAKERDMLKKAAKRIARQVKVPGFRPGKAPFNVIVRRFGLEAVQQEALQESGVEQVIEAALKEKDIKPYGQAQLDSIEWNPLTIILKVPIPPKIELGNYRDIHLESEPVEEVTEADVEQALKGLQDKNATWAPVERPSEIGDLISMSVLEKEGDDVLTQQDSLEYELTTVEEENDQPDLTTPLLGLSGGDEKIFTVTYPENFRDNRYAGKDITFEVEVSSVKVKEVDPLDDEFAKSVSEFETLEELKDDLRESIRQGREKLYNQTLGNQVLEEIIENAEMIEWPLALEEESIKQEIERIERQIKESSLTMEGYLQMQAKTEGEFRNEVREDVVKRLKRTLALSKIIELENVEVSESEILERAKFLGDISGLGDQVWQNVLASPDQQDAIANGLLVDKVIIWLAALAKGEISESGPDLEPGRTESTVSESVHEVEPNEIENNASQTEPDGEDEAKSEATMSEPESEPNETVNNASQTDEDEAKDESAERLATVKA